MRLDFRCFAREIKEPQHTFRWLSMQRSSDRYDRRWPHCLSASGICAGAATRDRSAFAVEGVIPPIGSSSYGLHLQRGVIDFQLAVIRLSISAFTQALE